MTVRKAQHEVSFLVPRRADGTSDARCRVRRLALAWGLGERGDDAETLIAELLSDVIRHTESYAYLRLAATTALRVEVSDADMQRVKAEQPNLDAENGWGLWLVQELSDRWGCDVFDVGKTVWFELDRL
jgi:hypothetical protein